MMTDDHWEPEQGEVVFTLCPVCFASAVEPYPPAPCVYEKEHDWFLKKQADMRKETPGVEG